MLKKILVGTFLFLCISPLYGHARSNDIARFDLVFFGYQLGMSYDEASSVRSFDVVGNLKEEPGYLSTYEAIVHSVYVDGLEARIKAEFMDEQLFKVVVRFSPALFEEMVSRFLVAYGPGENASKLVDVRGGGAVKHTVYKWVFPGSSVLLIGSSNNTEFATASLFARNEITSSESSMVRGRVRPGSLDQE